MSPERVLTKSEISLGGVRYPLVEGRPVQSMLTSIYPPKYVIGDTTKDSGMGTSVVAWSFLRDGMGMDTMEGPQDVHRAWYLHGQRRRGHIVLPPLATQTALGGTSNAVVTGELSDAIYASFGTQIFKYDNGADSWGTFVLSLAAAATDALTVQMRDGVDYLVFAQTSDYDHTPDGITWTRSTRDTKYLAVWDDRLWGIDNGGQLWYSITIGTETLDAKLPLPTGFITKLFVGPDASGNTILYAGTKVGLWAHDAANARFVPTRLVVPRHEDAGTGSCVWRSDIYFNAGESIYKYATGGGSATVSVMGPDLEDGLPSDFRGSVTFMAPTHNELIAFIGQSEDNPTTHTILGWNGLGWEVKHEVDGDIGNGWVNAYAGYAYSKYRLWWPEGRRLLYIDLQSGLVNPKEITTLTYATPGKLVLPWFTAGQSEVDKLAIRLRVEVDDMSSDEKVTPTYYTNYGTSGTALTAITADGVTTYDFPNSTTPTGTAFRAIRLTFATERGGTNTRTPDIISVTLEYRKKLPPRWGHTCEIYIPPRSYKGNTAKQLRSNLRTAIESTTLVEFTFRDDDGDTRNFFVDVASVEGLEQTGHDESGITKITVMER